MRLITAMIIMPIVAILDQEPLVVNAMMVIWVMVLFVNVSMHFSCSILCFQYIYKYVNHSTFNLLKVFIIYYLLIYTEYLF